MFVQTNHTIIGTAGHIDHGKTALIKALTGIDVDTLAEEKRRGITIELGFAFLDTPGFDKQIVFIDVPGHEKLIKTMVAGASNLDAVLFVIAADDGINAQTLEHFDILQLLGITDGVIALTKSDLVDDTRIRAVTEDIRSLTSGTFLADAPVIPVSSITGTGVDEIKEALVTVARKVRGRRDSGIFRMPIDRAFTMHGFGTVIAGTILSGEVSVGDKLEILPDDLLTRVRSIQVHSKSVDKSHIGIRTAINLQDIKKEQLRRGQCACAPGSVTPTTRIDAQFHLLRSYGEELKNRTRVRFHVGADEVIGRIMLLDGDHLAPGQTTVAQIVLESPTVTLPKDRFVVRTFSSLQTIGGGTVLDSQARVHKRSHSSTADTLERLKGGLDDIVEQAFVKSGVVPMSISEAAAGVGESEESTATVVESLLEAEKLFKLIAKNSGDQSKYLSTRTWSSLIDTFTGILRDYYSRNPYKVFMPVADLQSRFLKFANKQVYEAIILSLEEQGLLKATNIRVGLTDREPEWKPGECELAEKIVKFFETGGYSTPTEEEVQETVKTNPESFRNIMTALLDSRRLVRLGEKVIYTPKNLRAARDFVVDHIKKNGGVTAAELRDKLNITRKYAIAILEYLDNAQITRRLGDKRVLR